MYIRDLIPRNSTELAEVFQIGAMGRSVIVAFYLYLLIVFIFSC